MWGKKLSELKIDTPIELFRVGCNRLCFVSNYVPKVLHYKDNETEYDFGCATLIIAPNPNTPHSEFIVEFWTAGHEKARNNDYFDNIYSAMGEVIGHIIAQEMPDILRSSFVSEEAKDGVI